jgi:hypothetical protein
VTELDGMLYSHHGEKVLQWGKRLDACSASLVGFVTMGAGDYYSVIIKPANLEGRKSQCRNIG